MTGYKTWAAGEILTASDLNGYLRDQSIPIFATTTARDAAITSPVEGQVCYAQDTDSLYVYHLGWVRWTMAWQSWTPTWTGVTKGTSPTETYYYAVAGRTVFAQGSLTLGTGGGLTGSVTVTMPLASAFYSIGTNAGPAFFFDTSASSTFQGTVDIASSSNVATLRAADSATPYLSRTNLSSTIPFAGGAAWAVGDRIGFNVTYQVA